MIDDPIVARRIQESILRHADAGILAQLPDADLAQVVRAAAADPVRVADARWLSAEVLAWNRNNLRSAVCEALENTLVRRASALCRHQDLRPEPSSKADAVKTQADDAVPLPTPTPTPPPAPKEEPPAPKPVAASTSTPQPPRKEDWFDGFLTFISNIFS